MHNVNKTELSSLHTMQIYINDTYQNAKGYLEKHIVQLLKK